MAGSTYASKQTYPQIKSPLHFYGTSGLSSSQLIIKILLMPLTGPDNPLLCHYFCYYLDNEMFTTGNTLNCSYRGLGGKISDLHSLRTVR